MSRRRNKEEQTFWVPIIACNHRLAFDENNQIALLIGAFKNTMLGVELIEGDIKSAFHLPDLQASEQYFTSSQFLAHFFRHSKGRSQRWQSFGAKPFLVFAP
jgi:hypothetical protein